MIRFKAFFLAGLVLAVSLSSGCSSVGRCWFNSTALTYVPARSALEPRCPPDYSADPNFHGYYQTCWKGWPEDWNPCPHRETCCVCQDSQSADDLSAGDQSDEDLARRDFGQSVELAPKYLPTAEDQAARKPFPLDGSPVFTTENISNGFSPRLNYWSEPSPISVEAAPQSYSEIPEESTQSYFREDSIEGNENQGAMLFAPPQPQDFEGGSAKSNQGKHNPRQYFSVSSYQEAPVVVAATAATHEHESLR